MDWNNFYMTTAGASAALLGLLFVAIQIHLDVLAADSKGRWLAIARSTFYNFVTLFALSLLMLFPTADNQLRGAMLLFVATFGLFRLLTAWLPVWRGVLGGRHERILEILWMLASPLTAYILLIVFARELAGAGAAQDTMYNIGFVVVGLFVIVLRNSWRLLVEVVAGSKSRT